LIFIPTISQVQGVTVTTDNGTGGVTYEELISSLGAYVYQITDVYIYSENFNQITGAYNYLIYDANGNEYIETIVAAPDINQSQNALYIDTKNKNLIINGNNNVSFNVLPNTNLQLVLYTIRISVGFDLEPYNFLKLKSLLRKDSVEMFQEYETGVAQSYEIIQGRPVRKSDQYELLNAIEQGTVTEEKKVSFVGNKNNSSENILKLGLIGGAIFLTYKLIKK
jgi:hypothetical protein